MSKESRIATIIASGTAFAGAGSGLASQSIDRINQHAGEILTKHGEVVVGKGLGYMTVVLGMISVIATTYKVAEVMQIFSRRGEPNPPQNPPNVGNFPRR